MEKLLYNHTILIHSRIKEITTDSKYAESGNYVKSG